jgi:hypothetical protein
MSMNSQPYPFIRYLHQYWHLPIVLPDEYGMSVPPHSSQSYADGCNAELSL